MRQTWITFVESSAFTNRVQRLGLERAVRHLQTELVEDPTRGDLDPETGGLQKIALRAVVERIKREASE